MKEFEELKKEIEEGLNDYSFDFLKDYRIDDNCYVSDAIGEFADRNTSLYYSDPRDFYYNNTDLCNNALIKFGYDLNDMIKKGSSLDDLICQAGAVGEYQQIEETIRNDLEDILKLLLINHIIENNIECDIDVIENFDIKQINRFSDLLDYLDDYLEEEE